MKSARLLLVLVLVLSPLTSFAGTLRVPQDFPTVQDAVAASVAGDTIVVSPGFYTIPVSPCTLANGSQHTCGLVLHDGTALVGLGPAQTVLDFSGADIGILLQLATAKVKLLHLRNAATAIYAYVGSNITVTNVIITDLTGPSVLGMELNQGNSYTIHNNTIDNIHQPNDPVGTAIDVPFGGVSDIQNNLLTSNTHGVTAGSFSGGTYTYNDVFGSTIADWSTCDANGCTAVSAPANNISTDPLYCPDFTLQSGSPARSAGNPAILNSDGTRSNMGAYGGPEAILPPPTCGSGGTLWKKLTGPWSATCEASFGAIAIHPRRPNVIYVGSTDKTRGCGVYRSVDRGITWVAISRGLPLIGLLGERHYPPISKIAISPQLPTVIFAGTFEDNGVVGFSGHLFLRLDGGQNWLPASGLVAPRLKSPILDIAINPNNPAIVIVGLMGDGIFLTRNGGITWKQIRKGTVAIGATDYFTSVKIALSDPSIVYASGFTQYTGPSLPCFFSFDGCVEVDGIIPMRPFASRDSGTSWSDISDPDSSIPSVCLPPLWPTLVTDFIISPNDKNKLYAATMAYLTPNFCSVGNRGVFRSSDGGVVWQAVNEAGIRDIDSFPMFQLALVPGSESELFAVAGFNGVVESTNGGDSWSFVSNAGLPVPTFTRRIAINDNSIYALTSAGIYVNSK